MLAKTKFFLLMLVTSIWGVYGQQLKFEHYNDRDGLSHNSVRHIVQDKNGFLWLGTFSGLNRFDGYEFKSYTSSLPGQNKINNNDITALELDQNSNTMWLGTRNGLTRFNMDTYTFKTFLHKNGDPNSLPDNEIRSVHVDKFNRVWVGTKNKGLCLFFPKENRFSKIDIPGFEYIKELFEDKEGRLWIGSYGKGAVGRITLDNHGSVAQLKTYTLAIPRSKEKNPYINFIYEDHKSAVFIGTREGLYKLNKTTDSFENLYIKDDTVRDKLGPYFLSVARAPNGKYWVGTLGGLLVCDQLEDIAQGDFQWYYAILSDDNSLVDNLVSSLYFDASGVLWIGTEGGLDKYDPYENQFTFNKDISLYIGNQAPRIRGFQKTADNKVIVATRHNGLFISKERHFVPLYKGNEDIASIYSEDGKTFYCGLWNGKILVYHYKTNTAKVIDLGFKSPIMDFLKLNDRRLLIGSFGEGEKILDSRTLKPTRSLLPGYQINEIAMDSLGNVWSATETGVVRYKLDSGISRKYSSGAAGKFGLPHNNTSDILIDPEGKIWAATRNGLCTYDTSQDDFITINKPKELQNAWITDLVTDNNGDLWLNMNNNSVARLDRGSKNINVYPVNSGNRLDVFSSSGFYNYAGSPIYLGAKSGVIYFSPDKIKENYWSPAPVITQFKVQNKEIDPGTRINGQQPLKKNINLTRSVTLNYANRNISIKFSAPSFSNERLNKFAYKLEGFDKEWIAANNSSRSIQYTNLYPDDYVFKVKASNSDGHWSDVVSYDIRILPPFWLTYRAFFLGLFCVSLIFYFVRREVKARLHLRKELLLEKIKRDRDDKLNNEKLRFFTNISHELRTPLTLILGPAKQLLQDVEETGNRYHHDRYKMIHKNANRLLNLVNQVLDFRKAGTGELELKVTKTDILSQTKNTFESFKDLADNKKIHFNLISETETLTGYLDRNKYDKILYNLLSNAIKFAPKYGNVDLFIGTSKVASTTYFTLEISDDGIGIPLESQAKIFSRFYQASNSRENNTGSGIGLSLVKALIELHKGRIEVQSTPDKGSIFTLEIPIAKSAYNENEVSEEVKERYFEDSPQLLSAKKIIQNNYLKEKILIIENNAELRNYLVDYLSDYFKVYDAENGQMGIQLCRELKPALCVTDVMMPMVDGFQFCNTLKNDVNISHIPVILMTALSEDEDKIKGYNQGADGYLVKPFDPSLLKILIESTIKTRLDLKTKFSADMESEINLLAHSSIDEEFMGKIIKLIENELAHKELSPAFLCKELAMSSSKLYRKIKELTDLSPNEFIKTVRLKKSAQLLKTKKYNVSEVTDLIGFNDPLYFSRCFKKQFGFPPSNLIK